MDEIDIDAVWSVLTRAQEVGIEGADRAVGGFERMMATPDATWNAATEAAAELMQKEYDSAWTDEDHKASLRRAADTIRALKRGGK